METDLRWFRCGLGWFICGLGSDFIWPFLRPYMGVIPNPKMVFIFPISCILALIFPILIKYFPKCVGKGSFPKSQIKSLLGLTWQIDVIKMLLNVFFKY